eukprot:COSAG01_NODE_473_length_16542_cov_42.403651_2_plen_79_part_00
MHVTMPMAVSTATIVQPVALMLLACSTPGQRRLQRCALAEEVLPTVTEYVANSAVEACILKLILPTDVGLRTVRMSDQ